MSLILCSKQKVERPYMIEELGVRIFSAQELCYVIRHNPFLISDGLIEEKLVAFLVDELDMALLGARLKKGLDNGNRKEDLALLILNEVHYDTQAELSRFREELTAMGRLHPAEYAKQKADYYCTRFRYGKAIQIYGEILEANRDGYMDNAFIAKIYNNLATAYVGLFQFEKAMETFRAAYDLGKERKYLKAMYLLSLLEPSVQLEADAASGMTNSEAEGWKKRMEEWRQGVMEGESAAAIKENFEKDPIRRISGAKEIIGQWKQEYRKMV